MWCHKGLNTHVKNKSTSSKELYYFDLLQHYLFVYLKFVLCLTNFNMLLSAVTWSQSNQKFLFVTINTTVFEGYRSHFLVCIK